MPFKIVQTFENGKSVLTVVPSAWEKAEVLFWPRRLNETKLIHDEFSVPKTDWKTMRCKTKREYVSQQEADVEVERMEQLSDTENDSPASTPRPIPRPRKSMGTHILAEIDLNHRIGAVHFDQSNTPSTSSSPVPLQVTASSNSHVNDYANEPVVISVPTSQVPSVISVTSSGSAAVSETNLTSNVAQYEMEQSYQNSNQLQLIYEQQKHIKHQLAVLQASVDFIMQYLCKTAPDNESCLERPFIIKPVSNYEELQELEKYLKNDINFLKTVDAMTFICGSSGKSRGIDSCYKLIDYFFTRDLLLNCSWTGTSRQGSESKIPLKYFCNTRKCFLTLVIKSDKDFGEQDCDKFFKTIIKNAKQRLNPKIMSATKHRGKKDSAAAEQGRPLQALQEQAERNEHQTKNQSEKQEEAGEQVNKSKRQAQASEQTYQTEEQAGE